MLLVTLGASLLGNVLTGKGIARVCKGIMRACYSSSIKKVLIPRHSLRKFGIKDYYKNEPRFNSVYSRNDLPKIIKNGAYVINLDKYANVGTH